MAFRVQVTPPVPVSVEPSKTNPLIKCIMEKKPERLRDLLRGRDINGLYPSEDCNDDVTLLTAAVICRNEDICSFLLKNSADPNKRSTKQHTPLDYAAFTAGVPLSIVKRLLAAKASPNGHESQKCSPLQFAAEQDRGDIVKALLEAGASPEKNYGLNPEIDKKVERMIDGLSSQSEEFRKVRLFFSLSCAVRIKKQPEVCRIYQEHFFEEHPFIHTILFEHYSLNLATFGFSTKAQEYRQSAIEWLKETNSTDRYIEGVIKRFPKLPEKEHLALVLNCLIFALIDIVSVSSQVVSELVPILTDSLQHFENKQEQLMCLLILRILNNLMKKASEQKLRLKHSVYEKLSKSVLPFTEIDRLFMISVWAYALFVYVYEFAPELVEFTSVPERVIEAAWFEMDESIKTKLQKLDESLRCPADSSAVESLCEETANLSTSRKKKNRRKQKIQQGMGLQGCKLPSKEETPLKSIEKSNPGAKPFIQLTENPNISKGWLQNSHRWRVKLEKIANMGINDTYRLGNLTLVLGDEFLIANGSDGTQVFLGLRDDGTEVAVKRMIKYIYRVLKNEKEFLRLPELESPSIVRYVDFAEDANFGYLALQLCEYTLEEYIQDHLPEDKDEKTLVLKKLAKEVLCSLQVLHDQQREVLHCNIKPQNVLIDINGKARLADFGIRQRLRTSIAGTRCWRAKETIDEEVNNWYIKSSDVQVAGMLVYYILSGGHHPFGKQPYCEVNILQGKYSLEYLDDDVAKDLIEWMINKNPNNRPTVEQSLAHPFFWTDERRVEYLKIIGNLNEAENCRKVDEECLHAVEKFTEGKSFSQWKTKFPSELVRKLEGKKKGYPENTLGLLRFIRNLHEHYSEDAASINLLAIFPDLFGSVYRFAKEKGWHSRASLKKFFSSVPPI